MHHQSKVLSWDVPTRSFGIEDRCERGPIIRPGVLAPADRCSAGSPAKLDRAVAPLPPPGQGAPRLAWSPGWPGRHPHHPAAAPWQHAPRPLPTARLRGIGQAERLRFRTYGQAVLTGSERHSRLLLAVRPPSKAASPRATARARRPGALAHLWRQTITCDNGTEFARQHRLHALGLETRCCASPRPLVAQRGRDASGRQRRELPRKTDLATLTDTRFTEVVPLYNNTPRKCLDYRTPAEVFEPGLLPFQCASTFPLARE